MVSYKVIVSPKALSQLDAYDAYVDAIYHQLQDYENLFSKDLK